ncbi:MAG: glycosyltransferase [Saprospiraceae bacterium]|nr:glycosyltransferase [Saprospiraceae bacterium]
MKLGILTSRFPYPLERGDKLRIFHQIRYLSDFCEIYLFSISDTLPEPDEYEKVKSFCKEVYYYKIDKVDYAINLARNFASSLPLQVSCLYHRDIQKDIKAKVSLFNIDMVYCQLIRMAPYAENLNVPVVLDFMDAFGVGMKRRASTTTGLMKWLYKYESQKVLSYEFKISEKFTAYTIISKADMNIINVGNRSKVHVIPNGIDTTFFKATGRGPVYDVVFVGNLGYLPNVEAAEILVNKIAKLYHQKYKIHLKILLSGARPAARVWALENEYVDVKPWREDIRAAYEDGKVLVAPLFNGTGQQNKILEAMAMGIPCVTTTSVNEAIGAKNGDHILVADQIQEMASAIHLLLRDDEIYLNIKKKARSFVEDKFSWETSVAKLNSIFVSILNKIDVY